MHERILFLDIDGVLVTPRTESIVIGQYSQFDSGCVAALNRIIASTGAKLVLCSSWRIDEDINDLREYFLSQGVVGDLVDMTPVRSDADREREILQWLGECPSRPRFAILDDDLWFDQLSAWHVRTDSQQGLSADDVDATVALLESSP